MDFASLIKDPFVVTLTALALVCFAAFVAMHWPKRKPVRPQPPARRVPQPPPAVVHKTDDDTTYPLYLVALQAASDAVAAERRRVRRQLMKPLWLDGSGRPRPDRHQHLR